MGASNSMPYPCHSSVLAKAEKKGRKPHCGCKWNKQPGEKASSSLCWQSASVLEQEGLYPLEKDKLLSDTVEKTDFTDKSHYVPSPVLFMHYASLRQITDSGFLCMRCLAVLIIVLLGFMLDENHGLRKIRKRIICYIWPVIV